MHLFYRVMKGIYQFAENLLSYIPTKYYWNRSTSDLVIVKSKRVNFFWNTVYIRPDSFLDFTRQLNVWLN